MSETQAAQGFRPDNIRFNELTIRNWLVNRSANTARAYRADVAAFFALHPVLIGDVTLDQLQSWDAAMRDAGLSTATRARRAACLRSLLSFAHKMGLTERNVGALLATEKPSITSAEHIIDKATVNRMIAGETDPRRRALLLLLYRSGLRASEAANLRWLDVTPPKRNDPALANILGKGAKRRVVQIPRVVWQELADAAGSPRPEAHVLTKACGGKLDASWIFRAVRTAARRVGIAGNVSPHWLRHTHASHALDDGCKLHVLRESLGHASLNTTTRYVHARKGEGSASFIR
ncbi:tyrosine-type recombinase/integrase [Rhizosaccharibacter radicis]|uniref:Tyrosine-type recombinase/integrase n=1 Tax=Rhizosaccharibacter radicis TaxID=2782605 RepID=A0ABT1VXZ3_9PROT|nr:tyrosine-type recombinase/integrase [Acetobacteraceae bacterium KSS12]